MKRISKTKSKLFAGIGRSGIGRSVAWLFVLLLAGSCTQADVVENGIPPQALKEVDAEFNLSVQANQTPVTRSITFTPDGTIESDTLAVGAQDAAQDAAQTKAAAALSDDQEKKIAELWVGQYDAAGKCLFRQYLKNMTSNTVILKLKQSKDKSSVSHVYFVTNAGDLGDIAQEKDLLTRTLKYASTVEGLPENDLCPMMGMWEGPVAVGGVKDIVVDLTRLLAKITFTYSMGAGFEFTPASLTLENAPTASQVEAPKAQLAEISYITYTGENDKTATTVHWYLPENMAGTVTGDNVVDSKKKKIGKGVENATCIVLTGTAKQGGVTYGDVTFRFYPGTDDNNYDIQRNAHYATTVTLMGIDIADERITVGTIPPIDVDDTPMPAKKGSTKEIQITARPGQEWVFDMPDWLSALLDNTKNIPSGATTTHQGPALLLFKAETANPTSQPRTVTFPIHVAGTPQEITITQAGSTLEVSGAKTIDAAPSTGNTSTFTATEGLSWAISANQDWLTLKDPTSGDMNATGSSQNITYDAVVNPDDSPRNGDITVKAGDAITGTDAGLTKTIMVTQEASSLTASISPTTLAAKANAIGTFTMNGTKGLAYSFTAGFPEWLTVTDGSASTQGGTTTSGNQQLTYKTKVNPNESERNATVTVQAGNISKSVTVKQSGSTFSITNPTKQIPADGKSTTTGSIEATEGLEWAIKPTMDNGITVSPESGTGEKTLTFTGADNTTGVAREGKFTIYVTDAPGRTAQISVTQKGADTNAYVGNLQVCKTEGGEMNWSSANTYCDRLETEGKKYWRLPTIEELKSMYASKGTLEAVNDFTPLSNKVWSSSTTSSGLYWIFNFSIGGTAYNKATVTYYVRCVRAK